MENPVTVRLPINRAIIGPDMARRIFMACRWAARRIDPDCSITADYHEHERIGWTFTVRDPDAALLLLQYHVALVGGGTPPRL